MLRRSALIILLIGAIGSILGQHWIEIGTGTLTENWPFHRWNDYAIWEGVYLQTEINYAGNITHIGFRTADIGEAGVTILNCSIFMKETTLTAYPAAPRSYDGYTLVWTGAWPNADTGWNWVALHTPFYYSNTPGRNLSILITKGYQPWAWYHPLYYYTATGVTGRTRREGGSVNYPPWYGPQVGHIQVLIGQILGSDSLLGGMLGLSPLTIPERLCLPILQQIPSPQLETLVSMKRHLMWFAGSTPQG